MTSTVTAIVSRAGIQTGLYFLSVGHASLLTFTYVDEMLTTQSAEGRIYTADVHMHSVTNR